MSSLQRARLARLHIATIPQTNSYQSVQQVTDLPRVVMTKPRKVQVRPVTDQSLRRALEAVRGIPMRQTSS